MHLHNSKKCCGKFLRQHKREQGRNYQWRKVLLFVHRQAKGLRKNNRTFTFSSNSRQLVDLVQILTTVCLTADANGHV